MRRLRILKARTSTIPPTLGNLGLDAVAWPDVTASPTVLANIIGKTAGSTVSISPNDGRFSVVGSQIIRGAGAWSDGPVAITLTETLAGAPNSPHASPPISVTVTAPALANLTIDNVTWLDTTTSPTVLANIVGKTAGSTVSISPNDGRFVLNGAQTQILRGLSAWSDGPVTITLTETLAYSPNSPRSSTPVVVTITPPSAVPNLFPAAGFTGETTGWGAGDPFTATGGTVSEPTPSSSRSFAAAPKPSCAYHEDPREAMVADYPITFSAFALLGIAKLRVIINGNFVDIASVSPRTRHDWDNYYNTGSDHIEWGYQAMLQHASFPSNGWARIYAIAFPVDTVHMLPRVIGPFLIKRKTRTADATTHFGYYDHVYPVKTSPGAGEYANTNAGFSLCANQMRADCSTIAQGGSVGYEHVKIQVQNSFTFDILNGNTINYNANEARTPGHVDVICDSGVSLLFNKGNQGKIPFSLNSYGSRFGPGVRIDMHYIDYLYSSYSVTSTDQYTHQRPVTLMGCEVFDSGGLAGTATVPARFNKTGVYGYENELDGKTDNNICHGFRLLGVNWHDMYLGPKGWQLLRNTQVAGITADCFNPADMPSIGLQYALMVNVRLDDFDLSYWDTDTPGIDVVNTSGQTVTLDVDFTDPNHEGRRNLIWSKNGVTHSLLSIAVTSVVGTFQVGETIRQVGESDYGVARIPASQGYGATAIVNTVSGGALGVNYMDGSETTDSIGRNRAPGGTTWWTGSDGGTPANFTITGVTSGATATISALNYSPIFCPGHAGGHVTGGNTGDIGSSWTPPVNYMPADYVATFNANKAAIGLSGITLAMNADSRANTIPMGYAGEKLWSGVKTITSTPYTIIMRYDLHGDLFQPQGSSPENLIVVNSDFRMHSGQGWFTDWGQARDCHFINTVVSYYGARQVGHNTMAGPGSHLLFLFNDVLDDDLIISSLDPYSEYSCNVLQQCNGVPGSAKMDHNIFVENSSAPSGATNSVLLARGSPGTGNTNATDLFVDYPNRDYRPKGGGAVLANKVPTRVEVPFDINGLARGASTTAAGAQIVSAGG